VIGPAQVGLVLGMSRDVPELLSPVGELALFTIFARSVFLERTTQFGLVAARVGLGQGVLDAVPPGVVVVVVVVVG
jgi:hypothetical protein